MPHLELDSMRRQIDADPAEAVRQLEAWVDHAPTIILARMLLAEAYEAAGRSDDARSCWKTAHFLMPGSPLPEIALARLAFEKTPSSTEETPKEAPFQRAVEVEKTEEPREEAPEEKPPRPHQETESTSFDLDRLIEDLESAHIEPSIDTDTIAEPHLDNDIDDMVSETLARIHEAQDQYAEAARIYLRLSIQEPERADEFRQKAAEMRGRASGN